MKNNVQQIDQVHEVVQAEPNEQCVQGDFSKAESENNHPKVVQKGKRHHHGPVIAQPSRRIKHK